MSSLFENVFVRLLACCLLGYLAWRQGGLIGLLMTAPLFGAALARPILDLFASWTRATKQLVFADINGRHFAFRGVSIDIAEDDQHVRWISVADIRKVIDGFPKDAVLLNQYPDACMRDNQLRGLRIEASVLLGYMQRTTSESSKRFKLWLEREVVLPAERIRARA
jgi:hypothetical protein